MWGTLVFPCPDWIMMLSKRLGGSQQNHFEIILPHKTSTGKFSYNDIIDTRLGRQRAPFWHSLALQMSFCAPNPFFLSYLTNIAFRHI